MSIFVQAPVPHLGEPELPFDNAKLVFHLGPDPGHLPVSASLLIGQRLVVAALRLGEVPAVWSAISNRFFLAGIGGIAPRPSFFPVQQVRLHPRMCTLAGVATTE